MRILIDSNVYISGMLYGGIPAKSIALAASGFEIIGSTHILDEIYRVLSQKFKWPPAAIEDALAYFADITMVKPEVIEPLVRDAKDNPILACALAGNADYLITGDKDLLILKRSHHIKIITPRHFVDMQ